jgi:hypothetical protein
VDVHVVRSGGFAGLSREWRATARGDDELAAAVSACPWDSASGASPDSARDQFSWSISVGGEGARPGTVTLSDSDVTGPWKSLVDMVKSRATG